MKLSGASGTDFLKSPDPNIWAMLFYCADLGVAEDAASTLVNSWQANIPQLSSRRMDEDAIRKDPAQFFDALEAQSLLGDSEVILVKLTGDKSTGPIADAIKMGESRPGRFAARLILVAGALTTKSRIRKTMDTAKYAGSLQLFADTPQSLRARVEEALAAAEIEIDADALALFVGDLPGHRGLAHNEIEKLCLYARGLGRPISIADIIALSTTDIEQATPLLIYPTLLGQISEAQKQFDRLMIAGTSPVSMLMALQRETLRLLEAHDAVANGASDPGRAVRPPVWKQEWPEFSKRMKKWPVPHLLRILERTYEADAFVRQAGPTAGPVVRALLLDLARVAAR